MASLIFIFGLAIFLFSMRGLEQGIREASGEGLKKWIAGKTNNSLASAGSGVVVTAILQSSSMVSLIVLAFVSAGVMPLFNGIGVMLGANLGTTFTGWVATIIGFKMNLQAMIVPLLGTGAICQFRYFQNQKVRGVGRALFAFGLLIYGLDVMKESVSDLSEVLDIGALKGMPPWVYFLSGVFLAAAMQSSSAVMIITLSLLNSDLLELTSAAAIVIGADLGTTSTTVLGSFGESMVKKQLAFAQVFFNLFTNALAFAVMLPLLPAVLTLLSIQDTMFGLVTFHSIFNLVGLVIFLPILKFYTQWVKRILPMPKDDRTLFFDVPIEVPDMALNSLRASVDRMAEDAIHINVNEFELRDVFSPKTHKEIAPLLGSFETKYESLKVFEARIISYASRLQMSELAEEQGAQVASYVSATRDFVYACKTLKDVRGDYEKLAAAVELGRELYRSHRQFLTSIFEQIAPLCVGQHEPGFIAERLESLTEFNGRHFEETNQLVSAMAQSGTKIPTDLSTWFNLNHELHHCVRYWLNGAAERHQLQRFSS